jgi:hypothetical protein
MNTLRDLISKAYPKFLSCLGRKYMKLHIKESQMKYVTILSLATLLLLGCNTKAKFNESLIDNNIDTTTTSQTSNEDLNTHQLDYKVVEEKDTSYPGTTRMTVRLILQVNEIPQEADLRITANKLWLSDYKQYDQTNLFMYLPGMDTNDVAYVVVDFDKNTNTEFRIQDIALIGTKWNDLKKKENSNTQKLKDETASIKAKSYFVDISYSNAKSRIYDIDIKTNFPDGTNLLVDVTRSYYEKGSSEERSGDIFSKDLPVVDGHIKASVKIDDSIWYNDYQDRKRQFSSITSFPGVGKVMPDIEIETLFSPKRDQTAKIQSILGEDAEFISGKQVEDNGNFKTLRAVKSVPVPYIK